jgi:hypothetical protein
MTQVKTVALMLLICAGILVPAFLQRRAQMALRAENEALRHQAEQALRLSVENLRLSNSLAESKRVAEELKDQSQELLKVRAELQRFRQQQAPASNVIVRAATNGVGNDVASLRAEVGQLRQEIQELALLREQVRQLQAETVSADTNETVVTNTVAQAEEQPLSIRLIRTQGDAFAEKLKRSVGAKDDESFEEVFARFLQMNGIPTSTVAAAAYDARTGRVILRASPATLDQIESLTTALDRSQ